MDLHYHCHLYPKSCLIFLKTFLVARMFFHMSRLMFFAHAAMFPTVFRQSQSSEPRARYSAGSGCEWQSSEDQHRRWNHHLWKHQSRTGKSHNSRTVSLPHFLSDTFIPCQWRPVKGNKNAFKMNVAIKVIKLLF